MPWRIGVQVTLIHNPNAGDGSQPGPTELLALIGSAGHRVRYRSSKDEDLASALTESADLVAVAGGDGTIAKVATLMRGRDTPIALLPTGTANNIATVLGVTGLTLAQQVDGWLPGHSICFDIGRARGHWGSRKFVESFGLGLIAHMIASAEDTDFGKTHNTDSRMARGRHTARSRLRCLPAFELHAVLDGREFAGRFVLFEAMNIGIVGPNLNLAALADPTDGLLDLVLVREDERDLLQDCFQAEAEGRPWPHRFSLARGTHLRITGLRDLTHIDDEVSPLPQEAEKRSVYLSIGDRVRIVLPERHRATPS